MDKETKNRVCISRGQKNIRSIVYKTIVNDFFSVTNFNRFKMIKI